jgi:hypothetical protein
VEVAVSGKTLDQPWCRVTGRERLEDGRGVDDEHRSAAVAAGTDRSHDRSALRAARS